MCVYIRFIQSQLSNRNSATHSIKTGNVLVSER